MSIRFAVVHEAATDFQTATELADRVLLETIPWVDEDLLAHQREWLSFTWKSMRSSSRTAGIRAEGLFEKKPGLPDAAAARRALVFLERKFRDLRAVVLIRDQDNQPSRRGGLEQARSQHRSGLVIVIGFAVIERECWVISGFDPENEVEEALLATETNRLGFDPRLRSHDLRPAKDTETHSPKRVLGTLTQNDPDRESRCWQLTSIKTLRERGNSNGLADYLDEVRDRLAPLIGHIHRP